MSEDAEPCALETAHLSDSSPGVTVPRPPQPRAQAASERWQRVRRARLKRQLSDKQLARKEIIPARPAPLPEDDKPRARPAPVRRQTTVSSSRELARLSQTGERRLAGTRMARQAVSIVPGSGRGRRGKDTCLPDGGRPPYSCSVRRDSSDGGAEARTTGGPRATSGFQPGQPPGSTADAQQSSLRLLSRRCLALRPRSARCT